VEVNIIELHVPCLYNPFRQVWRGFAIEETYEAFWILHGCTSITGHNRMDYARL